MANCTRVPPELVKPKYVLELSEAEATHLRSVISRLEGSTHQGITDEASEHDDSIYRALVSADIPRHSQIKPNLVNRGT